MSTTFNTVVYVRSGSCTNGPEEGCNDDSDGCSTNLGTETGSVVLVNVMAGQTYFIIVDGFGGASGNFVLDVYESEG
jgi:hypothetical protein